MDEEKSKVLTTAASRPQLPQVNSENLAHALYAATSKISFQNIVLILNAIKNLYPNGLRIVSGDETL